MKKNILLFIFVFGLTLPSMSQTSVYNGSHQKLEFTSEEIDLKLSKSGIKPRGLELAPALLAAIPLVIDLGFKITNNILEKKAKEFSAEYSKHNSYLEVGSEEVPLIEFSRSVAFKDGKSNPALNITFKPENVEGTSMERYIYYYISDLNLNYSAAKSTSKFPTMDYTIELKLDYVVGKELKTLDMAPIVISSVNYGSKALAKNKYRTNLIPLPEDGAIIGASVKIVETNPGKVRAEKILSLWNDNKEGIKTIINNFVPKDEKEAKKEDDTSGAKGQDESSSKPVPKPTSKKPVK